MPTRAERRVLLAKCSTDVFLVYSVLTLCRWHPVLWHLSSHHHTHSVYIDPSIFLQQWSCCIVLYASASAEPREYRVHLVRLTCQFCEDPVQPANIINLWNSHQQRWSWGLVDSELTIKHHISKIASTCFYHLRRLQQLRGIVSQENVRQLVTSPVLSRLDYCNIVLAGLPALTIDTLQRVLNAAVDCTSCSVTRLSVTHYFSFDLFSNQLVYTH